MSGKDPVILKNPPILEAVLDIRISGEDGCDIGVFDAMPEDFYEIYPDKRAVHLAGALLSVSKDGEVQGEPVASKINGYQYLNPEGTQLVQFLQHGFAANIVRNYQSWEEFRQMAVGAWGIYKERANPSGIAGVSLRYINAFTLSLPIHLDEYFNHFKLHGSPAGYPLLPEALVHYRMYDAESFSVITVSNQFMHVGNDLLNVVLDISVSCNKVDLESIWSKFEQLRIIKNKVFFDCLSEKTIAQFNT